MRCSVQSINTIRFQPHVALTSLEILYETLRRWHRWGNSIWPHHMGDTGLIRILEILIFLFWNALLKWASHLEILRAEPFSAPGERDVLTRQITFYSHTDANSGLSFGEDEADVSEKGNFISGCGGRRGGGITHPRGHHTRWECEC